MRSLRISHTLEHGCVNSQIMDVSKLPKKVSWQFFHKPYACDMSEAINKTLEPRKKDANELYFVEEKDLIEVY